MEIIAHRGLWEQPEQKNSDFAIRAAVEQGFGVEVDLRDRDGRLVVSHDIADETAADFEQLLTSLAEQPTCKVVPWALNIKADGLQRLVADIVDRFGLTGAFCFDMSVPDGLGYLKLNSHCQVYTRQSEFECNPAFYAEADGVWLDEFNSSWITNTIISGHYRQNKQVCVVSPELHGRDYRPLWEQLKQLPMSGDFALHLCTDHPVQAREFFSD